ncbi:MAG: PilW family protein [Planctomycetota bacterium]|jgi:prepilin-type N-terminal cleavage/methylation domain-containing protein
MKKAFTLIELVVAVALLSMVLAFASTIFKVSIGAFRTAGANAEIMQKLRALTDQMNADFKGQIWRPPGKIRFGFGNSDIDGKIVEVRSDSIVFFANGDFQSTRQYDGKTVVGNIACIYYGLADIPSYTLKDKRDPRKKILVRRQTILTSDSDWNDLDLDDLREYCNTESLADLIADPLFDADELVDRPDLDPDDANDLVMYMAKGVDDFTIQYVGGEDPYQFKEFNEWRPEDDEVTGWPERLYPLALKFTFTLYDSRGVIKAGRNFTHIVYLGD